LASREKNWSTKAGLRSGHEDVGKAVSDDLIIFAPGCDPKLPAYKFYDGAETLLFERSSWSWFHVQSDGSRKLLNGVTNVVHIIDKSQALMGWATKVALAKLKRILIERGYVTDAQHVDTSDPLPLFEDILDEIITSARKADKEELDAAAETGHAAHEWIESYVKALLTDSDDRRLELLAHLPLDDRASNACIAACEWMSDHNVRWIATERKIFSLKHGYAGTLDGLARVDFCGDPACCPNEFKDRLTLVDWKTSNYLYIEYLLQTAAYQHAHQEETGQHIEDRWIIRLGKEDAEFDPWHMEGDELFAQDFTAFLNALALYRSVDALKERIGDVQEAKVAHRRAIAQAIRDAEHLIACPVSDTYKGSRKKIGCNGLTTTCGLCTQKYDEKHPEVAA
jgi:hypothetical protein